MTEVEYEKIIEELQREIRILNQRLIRSNINRDILQEALETQSRALKIRNLELEESRELIRNSEAKYRELAHHDILTRLHNRAYFQECLNKVTEDAGLSGSIFALFFIDLDRFKNINDSFGHESGDEVLSQTADRILSCVQSKDTVARIGGDEFAVLLTDIKDSLSVEQTARAICDKISKPFSLKMDEYHLGVSIGISLYPEDDTDPDRLLQKADYAMYSVKHKELNTYRFYRDLKKHRKPIITSTE